MIGTTSGKDREVVGERFFCARSPAPAGWSAGLRPGTISVRQFPVVVRFEIGCHRGTENTEKNAWLTLCSLCLCGKMHHYRALAEVDVREEERVGIAGNLTQPSGVALRSATALHSLRLRQPTFLTPLEQS